MQMVLLTWQSKGYVRSTRIDVTLGKNRWKRGWADAQNRCQEWCQTITLFKVETVRLGWCFSIGSEVSSNVIVSIYINKFFY